MIKIFPFTAILWLCYACGNDSNNSAFPEYETEFTTPKSKLFTLPASKPFQLIPPPDSLRKVITETKLDIDLLPAQTWNSNDFRPFTKPMTQTAVDWKKLLKTPFNLKNLPTQKLTYRVSILGEPTLSKVPEAQIKEEAETGLLTQNLGLPNPRIGAMLKAKNGTLWIGTESGLCRFEGEYYRLYTEEQGLSENNIDKLCEDSQGQLWVGTRGGGVDIIDPKAGIIKHLTTQKGPGEIYIYGLLADHRDQIWVGTWNGGVDIINEREGTVKHLKNTHGLSDNLVRSLLRESNGNIWVGTGSGADIVDPKGGTITHLNQKLGLSDNNIECILETKDDEIWMGTQNQVSIVNRRTGTIQHIGKAQGLKSMALPNSWTGFGSI